MPFGMYQDEQDEQDGSQGLISPMVRDYLMRKRQQQTGPQPVDIGEDLRKQTPPPESLTTAQENMAPLAAPQQTYDEAADSSGVKQAEQADMIAQGAGGIGKVLAQALNAKYAGHLKQPVDYSAFDSISQMGKSNLQNARAARSSSIEGFKDRDALSRRDVEAAHQERDFNISQEDRARKNSWQDESQQNQRNEWGNAATDRTRQLGMQSEEDDSNSEVSRSYQTMASKMTGNKSDYSGVSATRLKAALPALSKMYEFDQNTQARQDAMGERRQMHSETLQNRLEAAELARQQHAATLADKKAEAAKPKPLGNEQQKRKDDATGAYRALDGMESALAQGDHTFSLFGDNDYTRQEKQFIEYFGRLESGGAIGKDEAKSFKELIPRASDSKEQQKKKLADMKLQLGTVLKPLAREGDDFSPKNSQFPKTVRNAKTGLSATVSSESELSEARAEGFSE